MLRLRLATRWVANAQNDKGFWDFRFLTKAQNDNADLLRFAPCELLGGYAQMRVDLNLMRGLSLAERIKDESKI